LCGGNAVCGSLQLERPLSERLRQVRFSNLAADIPSGAEAAPFQNGDVLVPCGKRQQGNVPSLLYGPGKAALVRGANTGEPTWNNLAALGHKTLQQTDVAVRDGVNLLRAKLADLFATEELSAAARPTGWPAARSTLRPPAAGAGSGA
jgi:hypothetical protein